MRFAPQRQAFAPASARSGTWAIGLFLAVLALLRLVSATAEWHSRQVLLPRYCDEPEVALARLGALRSAGPQPLDQARRDYMVAAKLEFLVPRAGGESAEVYRLRLLQELKKQCPKQRDLGINSLFILKSLT